MKSYLVSIQRGHQVASGNTNDPNFPGGTIKMQMPFFESLGLDLSHMYCGTINAKFNCKNITLNRYEYYFKAVKWHKVFPSENFKFCACEIIANDKIYPAFIYQPQIETKPAHFQPSNQLELIAPFIENLAYGSVIELRCKAETVILQ